MSGPSEIFVQFLYADFKIICLRVGRRFLLERLPNVFKLASKSNPVSARYLNLFMGILNFGIASEALEILVIMKVPLTLN